MTTAYISSYKHRLLYMLCMGAITLLCFPQEALAQAVEAGYGKGEVLKFDQWLINDALKQQDAQSFWVGYTYQTNVREECGYASDYNYPAFTFGLLIADFNDVRLRYNPNGRRPIDYDSRCGTSFVAYASIRRAFFRTHSGWSADYTFGNGIGYNTHIYDGSPT